MVPKVEGIGIQEINSIICLCHWRHALILVIEHGCQHRLRKLGQGANVGLQNLPTDVDSDDRIRHFEIIEIRKIYEKLPWKFVKYFDVFERPKVNDLSDFGLTADCLANLRERWAKKRGQTTLTQLSFWFPACPGIN